MSHAASNYRVSAVAPRMSHNSSRNLCDLLAGLTDVSVPSVAITDLTLDSRAVRPGSVFIALPGTRNPRTGVRNHGVNFAAQAIRAGATVVLWEPAADASAPVANGPVVIIAVPQLGSIVGALADRFFDAPSRTVSVNAVTGTNGKTTTAYVLASAYASLGKDAAYAGTLGHGRINAVRPGTHTTPDAITVHREIAELRDCGVTELGIEVSSHALDQQRIAAVRIDTAVFTNLTHDHLDYHGTVEAYGAAKARLFSWPGLRHAVINGDDAFGREIATLHARAAVTTIYGRRPQASIEGARQVVATSVVAMPDGLQIDIESSWGDATLRSTFIGDFNVDNLLAVLSVLLGAGESLNDAVGALEACTAPPGRMERIGAKNAQPLVIVDYAHTPDALEKALVATRSHCRGKLVCVFGCGGDRDPLKRPLMGEIAERLADVVFVTDDNPRTEDGAAILADILSGMSHADRAVTQRNRAQAIERAVRLAGADDAVLIAGKGHEDYQIIGLETRYFSDRDVAQAALRGQS